MRLIPTVSLLAFATHSNVVVASGAASAAANGLKSIDYRYFVAGGVCAATSHGITTPIDVVKTRMQAEPEVRLGHLATANVTNCLRRRSSSLPFLSIQTLSFSLTLVLY